MQLKKYTFILQSIHLSMKIDDTLLTTTIHVDNKVKVVKSIRSSSTSGSSASSSSSSIGNSSTMTKNKMREKKS